MAPPVAGEWSGKMPRRLTSQPTKQQITLISESSVLVFLDGFVSFVDEK